MVKFNLFSRNTSYVSDLKKKNSERKASRNYYKRVPNNMENGKKKVS